MGFGKPNISLADVPAIVTAAPPRVSQTLKMVLMICVVIGLVSFLILLGKDPKQGWTSFQVNSMYWLVLSAAASGFAAVFQICAAEWARPLRRIFESASGYLTFAIVPFLVVYLFHGWEHIFHWAHQEVPGKEFWLSANFLYIRDFFTILLLLWITKRVINLGLQQDLIAIRSGLTGVEKEKLTRWQDKQYDDVVPGWGSDPGLSIREAFSKRGFLSPIVVIIYAFGLSLLSWDQVMSIDPHWYSTLFGPFIFMSGAYISMAWCGISIPFVRSIHPLFKQKIIRPTLHDLGKMLFGFCIFWTYLFWAHYLTFWYGNLPEETGWVIIRLREEPWHSLSWFGFWSLFLFPFLFGLSKDVKQIPPLLAAGSAISAFGVWMMFYIMIVPGQFPTSIPLSVLDIGVTLGFMGVFLLLAIRYLERVPLIPFGDLYR